MPDPSTAQFAEVVCRRAHPGRWGDPHRRGMRMGACAACAGAVMTLAEIGYSVAAIPSPNAPGWNCPCLAMHGPSCASADEEGTTELHRQAAAADAVVDKRGLTRAERDAICVCPWWRPKHTRRCINLSWTVYDVVNREAAR